jgi:hypothetical protein
MQNNYVLERQINLLSAVQKITTNTFVKFKFKSELLHYVLASQSSNSNLHNFILRTESDYDFGL